MNRQITFLLISIIYCSCAVIKQNSEHTRGYIPLSKFKRDTANYVRTNFINRKNTYLGKPVHIFLQDWELPVKSYLIGPGANLKINHINISSNTNAEINQMVGTGGQYKMVTLIFVEPLNDTDVNKVLKGSRLNWTTEARTFYGKQIIKELIVNDYLKK